ncbi:RES family NAD+ phosphorylase [Hoeflea sp. WL0058]|uniref:RES family NAD+ phosphorylase n=1 Tax=Flavimaribacter sediminis TaxID=2865987 RepID=A0AAE2ZRE0_9HYPH|nr:RES family NAD+ phosphorylase [Flavimaribacter sediminis]MBW8640751.1 RES family NAD+ phosphorylase [Flavimaribacter sediminis]
MIEGPRDRNLIDTLDGLETVVFRGRVWRVTRDGRDPTLFFGGGNRWDDGTFDVLYTSLTKDGAIAEMRYHLSRGQPVMPSKIRYRLHELQISVSGVLDLTNDELLSAVGIDINTFGKLPYLDRFGEYEACQKVAEAVHFLGSDDPTDPSAILVPNARHPAKNLVLFADYVNPEDVKHVQDHGLIDWS